MQLAFSADGQRLLIHRWDTGTGVAQFSSRAILTGKLLTSEPQSALQRMGIFSPNDHWRVGTDGTTVFLGARNGATIDFRLEGHEGYVTEQNLAFSPNSQRLATAGKLEVKIWDPVTWQELLTLSLPAEKEPHRIIALSFSKDGNKLLAALSDGTVWVWDASPPPGFKPKPK